MRERKDVPDVQRPADRRRRRVRCSPRSRRAKWGSDARWLSRAFAAAAALPLLPGLDTRRARSPAAARLDRLAAARSPRARAHLCRIDACGEPARLRVPARDRRGGRPLRSGGRRAVARGRRTRGARRRRGGRDACRVSGHGGPSVSRLASRGRGSPGTRGALLAYRDRATRPIALCCADGASRAQPRSWSRTRSETTSPGCAMPSSRSCCCWPSAGTAVAWRRSWPRRRSSTRRHPTSSRWASRRTRAAPMRAPGRPRCPTCATTCRPAVLASRSCRPLRAGSRTTCRPGHPAGSRVVPSDGHGPQSPALSPDAHAVGLRRLAGTLRRAVRRAHALSARRPRGRCRGPPAACAGTRPAGRLEACRVHDLLRRSASAAHDGECRSTRDDVQP